jgi:hypothetical protein
MNAHRTFLACGMGLLLGLLLELTPTMLTAQTIPSYSPVTDAGGPKPAPPPTQKNWGGF